MAASQVVLNLLLAASVGLLFCAETGAELTPVCKRDCTVKPNLPCSITRHFDDCQPPLGPPDRFPGKARDLKIDYKIVNNEVYIRPTWKPPKDGSIVYVTGFQMAVTPISNVIYCYEYNLQGANWTQEDVQDEIQFGTGCWIHISATCHVTVYTTPDRPRGSFNSNYISANFIYPQYVVEQPPSQWKTFIIYKYNTTSGDLRFSFRPAKVYYNFTEYTAELIPLNEGSSSGRRKANFKKPPYTFKNVPPGKYSIQVQPLDENSGKCNCKCRSSWDTSCPHHPCRKGCSMTERKIELEKPASPDTTQVPIPQPSLAPHQTNHAAIQSPRQPEEHMNKYLLYAIIGSAGGVGLTVVIILLIKLFRSTGSSGACRNRSTSNSSSTPILNEDTPPSANGSLHHATPGEPDICTDPLLGTQVAVSRADSVSVQQQQFPAYPGSDGVQQLPVTAYPHIVGVPLSQFNEYPDCVNAQHPDYTAYVDSVGVQQPKFNTNQSHAPAQQPQLTARSPGFHGNQLQKPVGRGCSQQGSGYAPMVDLQQAVHPDDVSYISGQTAASALLRTMSVQHSEPLSEFKKPASLLK